MFSSRTYIQRRTELKQKVGSGLIWFLGNRDTGMNYRDNIFPFRQDSTFLYYFGLDRPDLHAVIDVDSDSEILFGNELTVDDIVWTGFKEALADSAGKVGVHDVRPLSGLESVLAKVSNGRVHYLPPYRAEHELQIHKNLGIALSGINTGASVDLIRAVVSMRSCKSAEEIVEIEKAVNTSVDMHLEFMRHTAVGQTEMQVAGRLQSIAIGAGGDTSYPIILTVNGEVLHTHTRDLKISDGQMALCDAGAETAMHYCGDLTRTIPVGKRFNSQQAELYQVVLDSQLAAIEACRPGTLYRDIHELAALKLLEGLKAVGIVKGDPAEALRADVHTLFFQCGLGHMMGLDVHDMENLGEQYVGYSDRLKKSTAFGWKSLRLGRALEPGFVVTVEPGLYFIPFLIDRWKAESKCSEFINYAALEGFRNFTGIRIEDDLVITEDGNRVLGNYLPKSVAEIEDLRG